jgi:hypothetical protein
MASGRKFIDLTVIGCALSIGSAAKAEPLLLTCDGQMLAVSRNVSERSSLALAIDLDTAKVAVGSWGSSPFMGKPDDTVTFGKELAPQYGSPTGSVNRTTGEASVHIMTLTDGEYRFHGTCKRTQKLF